MTSSEIYSATGMMELISKVVFLPLLDSGISGFSADAVVADDCVLHVISRRRLGLANVEMERANVLWQMKHMGKSQIRRIAFSITVMCQQGLELNKKYSVPILQDDEISGYELAAWCYCTFITAFPSMLDKLQLPYAEHYAKAKANIG